MFTPEAFEELVAKIVELGFKREIAAEFAARIGDTPEEDGAGNWIVRDEKGKIEVRIPRLVIN